MFKLEPYDTVTCKKCILEMPEKDTITDVTCQLDNIIRRNTQPTHPHPCNHNEDWTHRQAVEDIKIHKLDSNE